MKPMLLRINREGEFIGSQESLDNQCGRTGQRRYRYFVTIESTNEALTAEHYVMDNMWCMEFFAKLENDAKPLPSCEDIAQAAVEHFISVFETVESQKMVNLQRVYVRIHGSDVSFIEAEWKKTV